MTANSKFALKLWKFIRNIHLLVWILIWTIIGILLGLFAKEFSIQYMGLLSSHVFLPMVKCIIVPLVFSTLVVGIAGHGEDLGRLGRMASKSMALFLILTLIAIFIGLIFGNVVKPGEGVNLKTMNLVTNDDHKGQNDHGKENSSVVEKEEITLATELHKIIPTSFYQAAAETNTLQIVFCACFFSIGILLTPSQEAKKVMIAFCKSLSMIMFKVTEIVMKFVPLAIAGAVAHTIAANGIGVLVNLGKLVACVYAGLIIFMVVLVLIAFLCKIPLIPFTKAIWEPLTIAFATASSDAALPLSMERLAEFGVPEGIVAFTIPAGYTFNLAGTSLYLGAAAMFAAQAGNVDMPLSQQIGMMLSLMLMAKGVAGVPRASLVILASGAQQFGLPPEAVPIILTIDEIMDMARTAVNLVGNCLACVIVAKWEGEYPPKSNTFTSSPSPTLSASKRSSIVSQLSSYNAKSNHKNTVHDIENPSPPTSISKQQDSPQKSKEMS